MEKLMDEALGKKEIVDALTVYDGAPLTRFFLQKMSPKQLQTSSPEHFGRVLAKVILHPQLGQTLHLRQIPQSREEDIQRTALSSIVTAFHLSHSDLTPEEKDKVIDLIGTSHQLHYYNVPREQITALFQAYLDKLSPETLNKWKTRGNFGPISQDSLEKAGDKKLLGRAAYDKLMKLGLEPDRSYVRHQVVYSSTFVSSAIFHLRDLHRIAI